MELPIRHLIEPVERRLQPLLEPRRQLAGEDDVDLRQLAEALPKLIADGTLELFLEKRRQSPVVGNVQDNLEVVGLLEIRIRLGVDDGSQNHQQHKNQRITKARKTKARKELFSCF